MSSATVIPQATLDLNRGGLEPKRVLKTEDYPSSNNERSRNHVFQSRVVLSSSTTTQALPSQALRLILLQRKRNFLGTARCYI